MRVFLDTSALVKRYHVEKGTDVIDNLLGSEHQICISRLSVTELTSAFAIKVRTGTIAPPMPTSSSSNSAQI